MAKPKLLTSTLTSDYGYILTTTKMIRISRSILLTTNKPYYPIKQLASLPS